jgi:uncharacterized protein YjiS (DUF1127 family)
MDRMRFAGSDGRCASSSQTMEKPTMTTADYQYALLDPVRGAPRVALVSRLRECVAFVSWLIDRQRQRRALLDLDGHLLNDIGVSPRQAREEGRKPFWR